MLKYITVLSGFRACGKSKIGEILTAALNGTNRVRIVDMSDAIKYFMARPQSEIGRQLQRYKPVMNDGGIIRDGQLIYTLCITYLGIKDRDEGVRTEHLIITGGMRTPEEAECLKKCGVHLTVVHITGNENDMMLGVERRNKAKIFRTDSSSTEKLLRGWDDYIELTVPSLRMAKNYHEINFRLKMRAKIHACITVMPFPDGIKARMKRRIKTGNHKACQLIDELDYDATESVSQPRAAHSAPTLSSEAHLTEPPFVATTKRAFAGAMPGQAMAPQ